MNFLYQITTSTHVYTLYEEDNYIFLHVLELRTEATDIIKGHKIMDVLSEDVDISFEDLVEADDIISIASAQSMLSPFGEMVYIADLVQVSYINYSAMVQIVCLNFA